MSRQLLYNHYCTTQGVHSWTMSSVHQSPVPATCHSLQVYLIEVNTSPALYRHGQVLTDLLPVLIEEVVQKVSMPQSCHDAGQFTAAFLYPALHACCWHSLLPCIMATLTCLTRQLYTYRFVSAPCLGCDRLNPDPACSPELASGYRGLRYDA